MELDWLSCKQQLTRASSATSCSRLISWVVDAAPTQNMQSNATYDPKLHQRTCQHQSMTTTFISEHANTIYDHNQPCYSISDQSPRISCGASILKLCRSMTPALSALDATWLHPLRAVPAAVSLNTRDCLVSSNYIALLPTQQLALS